MRIRADRKALENQKGRKSKAQKEAASTAPLPMGEPIKAMPAEVSGDAVARAKWEAIMAAYKQAKYVPTSGDVEPLARLCLLYSEAVAIRKRINTGAAGDEYLTLHKLLDSKRRLMLPLENSLLLNPVARMRGLPVTKPDTTPEAAKTFNI